MARCSWVSALLVLSLAASGAWAQAVWADLYARTCSSCHQGGGGNAPRLAQPQEWRDRLPKGIDGLTASAMRGLPNTAMLPKGGYDLTDEQVRGLVTWMVRQVQDAKVSQTQAIRVPIASSQLFNPSGNATLGELGEQLAVGLRMALGEASNAIEPVGPQTWLVRGLGIRVMAQGGVVTLSGTVHESRTVEQAATWVGQQPGVSQVVNRLVAASLFEWD